MTFTKSEQVAPGCQMITVKKLPSASR